VGEQYPPETSPILPAVLLAALALSWSNALRAAEALPIFSARSRWVARRASSSRAPLARPALAQGRDAFDGYTLKAYDARRPASISERDGKGHAHHAVSRCQCSPTPAAPVKAHARGCDWLLNKVPVDERVGAPLPSRRK